MTLTKETVKEILNKQIQKELATVQTVAHPPIHYKKGKISVVSLFSGAGGLDLGCEWAGIEAGAKKGIDFHNEEEYNRYKEQSVLQTVYALDSFQEAINTYSRHFNDTVTHKVDIRKLERFPKSDLMVFGFPCPGFSAAGPRLVDDERNFLYIHCCRALIESQPKVFLAENVKGMLTLGGGEAFRQIKEDFEAAGYKTYVKLVNAADYGVPQARERVIIVGVRKDLDFEYEFPKETHGEGLKPFVTLKDAIADLEDNPGMYYQGGFSSKYMTRNRKKSWDDVSFTIQASGRQAPMHPGGEPMVRLGVKNNDQLWGFANGEENERRLSTREAARIQTFPDWYEFDYGSETNSHNTKADKVYKQIGNAVPVKLGKVLLQPIVDYLYETLEDKEEDVVIENKVDESRLPFDYGKIEIEEISSWSGTLFEYQEYNSTNFIEETPTQMELEEPVQLDLFELL